MRNGLSKRSRTLSTGQTRRGYLGGGCPAIILYAAQFDRVFLSVVDHVGRSRIAISGFANTAYIYKILLSALDAEF